MNFDLQCWKQCQDFLFCQRPEVDRCRPLVAVPNQAAFTDHEAAGLQRGEKLCADVAIEVVEHDDQIELVDLQGVCLGIQRKEIQAEIEFACLFAELSYRDL